MTPRQRRLAQQRRKWEEEQAQLPNRSRPSGTTTTTQRQKPPPLPRRASSSASSFPRLEPLVGAPVEGAALPTGVVVRPASRESAYTTVSSSPAVEGAGAASAAAATIAATPRKWPAITQEALPKGPQLNRTASAPSSPSALSPPSSSPPQPSPPAVWPSLFSDGPSLLALPEDLNTLSGQHLASLAHQWAQEVVDWESRTPPLRSPSNATSTSTSRSSQPTADPPEGRGSPVAAALALGRAATAAATPPPAVLPAAAASRLSRLSAAVGARVSAGGADHQQRADLAWWVAHYDRDYSMNTLHPAMGVPFCVLPRFMPGLRLEDFMAEVELRRDVIYLDDGSRAVEEARLTGWQSDIGATFRYSGKDMQPQAGGMSPEVRKVRDALTSLTGVHYDSVLINYYTDGKCGMRYHVDPLYGRWTPNSVVVSLGDPRTFIFRAIDDYNMRWHYRVSNGDAVLMFGDCQERLQHCIRVERRAADAGPRMSLVFKERIRDEAGDYLLP